MRVLSKQTVFRNELPTGNFQLRRFVAIDCFQQQLKTITSFVNQEANLEFARFEWISSKCQPQQFYTPQTAISMN